MTRNRAPRPQTDCSGARLLCSASIATEVLMGQPSRLRPPEPNDGNHTFRRRHKASSPKSLTNQNSITISWWPPRNPSLNMKYRTSPPLGTGRGSRFQCLGPYAISRVTGRWIAKSGAWRDTEAAEIDRMAIQSRQETAARESQQSLSTGPLKTTRPRFLYLMLIPSTGRPRRNFRMTPQ